MTRFKEQLKANLGKWAAKHKRHNCAQLTIQHLTITQGVVIATKHSEKAVENLAKSIGLARLREETHELSAKEQYEEDCMFATVTFQADLDGTIHVQMADSPDVLATSEKQAIYEENAKNVLVRAADFLVASLLYTGRLVHCVVTARGPPSVLDTHRASQPSITFCSGALSCGFASRYDEAFHPHICHETVFHAQ